MKTSKKDSSKRQIEAAIYHFEKSELDCAITLAAAGEGILPQTDRPHLFRLLRPHNDKLDLNLFINWLKHDKEPDTATISELEAVIIIARAITKFIAVYGQSCGRFENFLAWGHEKGHLPKPR